MNEMKSTPLFARIITATKSSWLLPAFASHLFLVSCGVQRLPVSPEIAASPAPGEGFIVATMASRGFDRDGQPVPPTGLAIVHAKGDGANKSINVSMLPQIAVKRPGAASDLLGPAFVGSRSGDVLAIPVPAGDYHIHGWSVMDRAVTANVMFRNRLAMKVPFQVREGEATYVGRIDAVTIYGKNILGMMVPGEALVMFSDEHVKDLPRIAAEYPTIKKTSITRSNVPVLYRQEMKRIAETPSKIFGLFE